MQSSFPENGRREIAVETPTIDDQIFGDARIQGEPPSHFPEPQIPAPSQRTPFPTLDAITQDDSDEEHQWTLVVGEEKREIWPIIRASLVVILILAFGAAGYLYFVRWKSRPANANTQKTPEQLKALAAKSNENAKPQTETTQPPSSTVVTNQPPATVEKPVVEQGPKDEPAPGVKLVTLQAASFPNEAAATAYTEKLIKAGVPAYVIGVDLPHKGRWYRVRAGKFEKTEEARSSIAQWQKRAGSAGLSIQWIVLDYEKP